MDTGRAHVHGRVARGFEEVRTRFAENFSLRGDIGAAFAAYVDDECVVDLWGGLADADSGHWWQEDTIVTVFSGTKGLVGMCVLLLIERGLLELDAPVARYWPEFAAAGKQDVLVAHLVSHRAGLPGIRRVLTPAECEDDRWMARLLAEQEPLWPAGVVAYHPLTFGWLCGELVRRVDGRSVGRFFAEEVAAPLGLDVWIGLPEEHEPRVATLVKGDSWSSRLDAQLARTDPRVASAYANPASALGVSTWENSRGFRAAEIAGANGTATARSMARVYACLARGGELDGQRLLAPATVALGRRPLALGNDELLGSPRAFGVCFSLQIEPTPFGAEPEGFGHGGAGGSIHGAWPRERVAFSYVMSELRDDPQHVRSEALLDALRAAVARRP